MEEFALNLIDFTRFENLEIRLNNNLLTKLPALSINNKNNNICNVIIRKILDFDQNKN